MRRLNAPLSRTPLPAVVALAATLASSPAHAQLDTTRVASGLNAPIFATTAPGRADQLFIVERSGTIKIMNTATGAVSPTNFLSIPDVNTTQEGGFLGLAFHPDFANNGKFYVNVTTNPSIGGALTTRIREYTVTDPINGSAANPTPTEILRFAQPQTNHNGGWIGFKPNDPNANLYIMTGDGGGSDDNDTGHTAGTGNAQDITSNLLGKVLRINVDGDDFPADTNANYAIPNTNPFVGVTGDDEIFAYGLRNPFRASFDRLTSDLYIGDVGQNNREEIDLIPSTSTGGENFGWRLREGDIATPSGGVGGSPPAGNVDPIYDYESFGTGDYSGEAVTGGVLYRGPVTGLYGQYVFADYQDNHVWAFDPANPDATVQKLNTAVSPVIKSNIGNINSVVAFAEDTYGNLYIVDIGGEIFRIGLPGDINADGFVGIQDLNIILGNWNQSVTLGNRFMGDIAGIGDGFIGIDDLNVVLTNWNLGTPPAIDANIPEPATFLLCAALLPTLTRRPKSRSRLSDPAKKILDPAHL
ncbi:MAG: PQQ-dependent sugar dehydrogenase [Phycisphaerales bacterium]